MAQDNPMLQPHAGPGYWMYETSGKLYAVVERYLLGERLSDDEIAIMRAYLRQWIDDGVWRGQAELYALRFDIDGLTTQESIHAWIKRAVALGMDPL